MKTQKKLSGNPKTKVPKKYFLSEPEIREVQARRETLAWIHNLILGDIQNYLVAVVFPRFSIKEGQKTRVSDDATYLEVVE